MCALSSSHFQQEYIRQIHGGTSLTSSCVIQVTEENLHPNGNFLEEQNFICKSLLRKFIKLNVPDKGNMKTVSVNTTCSVEPPAFFRTFCVHLLYARWKCPPIYAPLLDFTFPEYDHPENTAHTTYTLLSQFITQLMPILLDEWKRLTVLASLPCLMGRRNIRNSYINIGY